MRRFDVGFENYTSKPYTSESLFSLFFYLTLYSVNFKRCRDVGYVEFLVYN